MCNQYLTYLLLLWANIHFSFSSNENKPCTTPNHENGKCIVITKCTLLYDLIKLKPLEQNVINYLRKSQCGFYEKQPQVCCPLNATTPTTFEDSSKTENLLPDLEKCGTFNEDRIFNGEKAQLGGYPWLALLEYQKPNGRGFHCGGVLINHKYVLTAAHCIANIAADWNLFSVRLGEHDLQTEPDCEDFQQYRDCTDPPVDVTIEAKIVHENFKPNDINRSNDIALIRLSQHINFTDFISPICLPPYTDTQSSGNARGRIAGWGASIKNEAKGIKMHDNVVTCEAKGIGNIQKKLRSDQLCYVPSQHFQNNSCKTDVGSALMAKNSKYAPRGNEFVYGILSSSSSVCSPTIPMVYTNVASFLKWINENIKP